MTPPAIPSPSNHGPSANLAAWICFSIMTLAVLTKFAITIPQGGKPLRLKSIQVNDGFILAAFLCVLGYTIAVSRSVSDGLGQHENVLTISDIQEYEKATFASEFLFVFTLAFSQLAFLDFVRHIELANFNLLAFVTCAIAVGLWSLISMFGVAFQCSIPNTWEIVGKSCFDQSAFWAAIGALNMTIDVALVVIPLIIISGLQMAVAKKVTLVTIFSFRLLNLPLAITRIVYVSNQHASTDKIFNEWQASVVTTVQLNVAVIVSCGIFLKPILAQLQPGWAASNVHTGLGFNTVLAKSPADCTSFPTGSVTREVKKVNHSANSSSAISDWSNNLSSATSTYATAEGTEVYGNSDDLKSDVHITREAYITTSKPDLIFYV